MKARKPAPNAEMQRRLRREMGRSRESRYDHRLHCVLLALGGMSARRAALLMGDSPRTVESWVRRFREEGLEGLREKRGSGRPARLQPKQREVLRAAFLRSPRAAGYATNGWDGKTVANYIERTFGLTLSLRHCQRLLRAARAGSKTPSATL